MVIGIKLGIRKMEGNIAIIDLVQTTIVTTLKQIDFFKHCWISLAWKALIPSDFQKLKCKDELKWPLGQGKSMFQAFFYYFNRENL